MGPKGPSAKGEEMTLEERVRRIEKWLTSNSAAEMISIKGAIRASLDAPRDPHPEDTANLSFEQRVALRLLEYYPAISADDLGSRVREIRAVVDAPRAEAEPAPAERTVEAAITKASAARVAYGDGRVSVWREIEEVLVGSGTDVTKPIPTRIRFLVAEGKRLRAERDEAREERDSLRDQLAECQRVLALGEKVDAITKEKIARLERGVREARWLTQRSEWSPNNSGTRLSAFDWTQVEDEYDERRAAWLKEFGS
jgi:DNA polymerase III psi subunit